MIPRSVVRGLFVRSINRTAVTAPLAEAVAAGQCAVWWRRGGGYAAGGHFAWKFSNLSNSAQRWSWPRS